jgi:hypothetical protein
VVPFNKYAMFLGIKNQKIYVYHDIISSRETLFAKLANIREGVNAVNTICTRHKQKPKIC